ncbi:entericidin A/B family lipoprotein [Sphingomonas sp. Tas61C01]
MIMKHRVTSALLAASLTLAGCHTVNGVGKDVKSAGTAVSNASGEDGKKK